MRVAPIRAAMILAGAASIATLWAPADATAQDDTRAGILALTQAYNGMGQRLFRDFAAGAGNVVFSPFSIGTAMAMVLAGARGETEREMISVLAHTLSRGQVNDANAAALAILNGYDQSSTPPRCPQTLQLQGDKCEAKPTPDGNCPLPARRVGERCIAEPRYPASARLLAANALMLNAASVSKDYEALLKDRYSAEVFRGATLETVNGWVNKRTEGMIPTILDKMSDLVLINAVYFKSRWAIPFAKSRTQNEFFNLTSSRQELAPTMLQRANYAVVAREGYRAIRMPYAVRSLSMIIALPNEVEGLGDVTRRLDSEELGQLLAALRKGPAQPVMLSLPRFKTQYASDLKEAFARVGMHLAFDVQKADFSGMTGRPASEVPAAVDQIVHRAVIDVSEESTEAAAATAAGMVVASAPPKPVEPIPFRVDHPFLFYVVDDTTGAVLFQGRILDPR